MKKLYKNIAIATICGTMGFAGTAMAGSSTGPVTNLIVNAATRILFKAGTANNPPACATVADEYALDASTAEGKAMYAGLLTAKALGSTVTVSGKGVCDVQPDRETVQFLRVN